MLKCDCEGWQKNFPAIKAQAIFCALQSAGPKYDGDKFKFCPWCGSELMNSLTNGGGRHEGPPIGDGHAA
jgi:hypothetical protein